MKASLRALAVAGLAAALVACGGQNRSISFERESPDEFRALTQPPLSLPEMFHLRPPRPGQPPPAERRPSERAFSLLFEEARAQPGFTDTGAVPPAASDGERALLARTGGDRVHPLMAEIVRVETTGRALIAIELARAIQSFDGPDGTGPDARIRLERAQ